MRLARATQWVEMGGSLVFLGLEQRQEEAAELEAAMAIASSRESATTKDSHQQK